MSIAMLKCLVVIRSGVYNSSTLTYQAAPGNQYRHTHYTNMRKVMSSI